MERTIRSVTGRQWKVIGIGLGAGESTPQDHSRRINQDGVSHILIDIHSSRAKVLEAPTIERSGPQGGVVHGGRESGSRGMPDWPG